MANTIVDRTLKTAKIKGFIKNKQKHKFIS